MMYYYIRRNERKIYFLCLNQDYFPKIYHLSKNNLFPPHLYHNLLYLWNNAKYIFKSTGYDPDNEQKWLFNCVCVFV